MQDQAHVVCSMPSEGRFSCTAGSDQDMVEMQGLSGYAWSMLLQPDV